MKDNSHFLSVVVPVYKQEKTIQKDLKNIQNTLDKIRYDYELIAVVDGLKIDSSYQKIKELKKRNPKLKLHALKNNHGKGYALRYGFAKSKGDYLAFIDAGMEIDPNGISLLIEHLEWYQADCIVASKYHPASQVKYPLDRKIVSTLAHLYSRVFLGLKLRDTQAGLKIFRRALLSKVLPRLLVKRYAIDLEILSVANHLGFKKIYEAPIKLNYSFQSLTHAAGLSVIFKSFIDALAVFYRLKILRYYNDKNQRRWIYDKDLKMRVNLS